MLRIQCLFLAVLMLLGMVNRVNAQVNTGNLGGGNLNTITTSVPFLLISPDARSGALGDAGVALSPDASAMHWNAAKMAFAKDKIGIAMNYTPWLRNLVPDIALSYLSGYVQIDDVQSFGASLRYFSLGDITFTDAVGQQMATFNPNEFAVDAGYSRKLSQYFSVGVSLRYIYSNLAGGLDQNRQTVPGQSFAGDLSFYFAKPVSMLDRKADLAIGLNISNIGNKIAYTSSGQSNFIPTNMRFGAALTMEIDEYNKITVTSDLNKLLVPTNPVYQRDANGQIVFDNNRNPVIAQGEDPNLKSPIQGIFSSFSDAPGGFEEELREINIASGVEYWYNNIFAVRGGYFYEHATKGGRKYFTMGAGLKYNVFNLNFAYLIPTSNLQGGNPLENTLRFSLLFDLRAFGGGE